MNPLPEAQTEIERYSIDQIKIYNFYLKHGLIWSVFDQIEGK